MDNIIEIKDVCFDYGDNEGPILEKFNLNIKRGSFVSILGHNGSGKSTVARLLNGLLLPNSGNITVNGISTSDEKNDFEVKKLVGLVFQNPDNQIIATIVEDDVAFGPENLSIESTEIRRRADEALRAVDMYEYRNNAPHLLSGGQKQRVAIAGILAMEPQCIVLDEPTAMLDPVGRKEVMSTLIKLNREKGITIVLITHYMEEAALADRIVVMDNGKIILDDAPKSVFGEVDLISKSGLSVPQTAELAYKLRLAGIDIGAVLTVDDCVNALERVLTEEK